MSLGRGPLLMTRYGHCPPVPQTVNAVPQTVNAVPQAVNVSSFGPRCTVPPVL